MKPWYEVHRWMMFDPQLYALLLQLRVAEKLRRLFGRHRVDEEAGTPFEVDSLRELGSELDVPVVVVSSLFV